MLMPNPDYEQRALSVHQFLESVEDEALRKQYKALLDLTPLIDNRIIESFPAPDGLPELRVFRGSCSDLAELRDLLQQICISQGLLDLCFSAQEDAETTKLDIRIPRPLGEFSVAKVSFMWAYAHEAFHFVRRHALVEKHFGADKATRHALEYDADLCAVAVVYRHVQLKTSTGDALQSKRAVLMNLFWFLRTQLNDEPADFAGSETHPYAAARMLDAIGKLAMLHNTRVADPNCSSPVTRHHLNYLADIFWRIEVARIRHKQGTAPTVLSNGLSRFAIANAERMNYTRARHERWDEISKLIEHFSRMPRARIDNEQSIAFIGDVFSLPRGDANSTGSIN